MAGAIAARRNVLGVAPRVGVLAVRAFDPRTHSGEGTTFNIIKGIEWSVENGARIINMSFAGPADPRLPTCSSGRRRRGIVLIAAAGNAGPNSPPLFPAADKNVIAVTATDIEDRLYTGANRGNHIAVAAPGVDVLVPAPGGAYQFTTGTSVAAAHVSGVVALLLERNPKLTPADVRRILTRTAKSLGPARSRPAPASSTPTRRSPMPAAARRRRPRPPQAAAQGSPGQQRPTIGPGTRLRVASASPLPPYWLRASTQGGEHESHSAAGRQARQGRGAQGAFSLGLVGPTRKEPGCLS